MKRLAARRIRSGTISIGDVSLFVEVVGHGYSWKGGLYLSQVGLSGVYGREQALSGVLR
jgi:hypothetical protein